jgi:hypothetical protein
MRKTRQTAAAAELHPQLDNTMLVQLTVRQLAGIVEGAVLDALDKFETGKAPAPALLSGAEMAIRLGISRTKMHRLREEGCPAVKVGDVFKYLPGRVMSYLEERDNVAG